jgi:hypothetical protein
MMKNYFFSNDGYGVCYTVMAESYQDAIMQVSLYIAETGKLINDKTTNWKKVEKARKKRVVARTSIDDEGFNIEEYGLGEVIETEYS